MGTTSRTRWLAALAAVTTALAGTATAPPAGAVPPVLPAAKAETTADGLLVTGTAAVNDLHATVVDGTTVDLVDRRPITTSGGCWHPDPADPYHARCTVVRAPELVVRVNGGPDTVTLHGTGCTWRVYLGPGDDVADTTDADCDGTWVLGNAGSDTFRSGTSHEMFDGGGNAVGGDGDTVSYAGGRSPLAGVTVDGMAHGGTPADEDVLDEVEDVIGSPADDTITGNNVPNVIDGQGGDDVLSGGTVHSFADDGDVLIGGLDDDTLGGGPGDDDLRGSTGDDDLQGGDGFDALDGGNQVDTCDVGPGGGTEVRCES
jgi:hypothetical protein